MLKDSLRMYDSLLQSEFTIKINKKLEAIL